MPPRRPAPNHTRVHHRSRFIESLESRTLMADGTFAFGAARYDVPESAGSASFTIERTGGSSGSVDVLYQLFGGPFFLDTATPGEDFTDVTGTVTFADGETVKTIVVPVNDDLVIEGDEHINVNFGAISGGSAGPVNTTQIFIHDDDSPGVMALGAAEYRVDEGDGQLLVTVTRGGSLIGDVGVRFRTAPAGSAEPVEPPPPGRATEGEDYGATFDTLLFAAGQTSASFTVPILDDAVGEGDERFMVVLFDPIGGATLASVADSDAIVVISDDDSGAPDAPGVVRGPDPADPLVTALVATGTEDDDRFRFVGGRDGTVVAFLNGQSQGQFAPSTRLLVRGGSGNDRVTLKKTTLQTWVFGGEGDDVISGTRGDDVLVGGPGDDRISGGAGNDLVIGGAGADRLSGGAGDDVLVSGTTAYDTTVINDRQALANVLTLWSREAPYAERIADITSAPQAPVLTPDSVFPDTGRDLLAGQGRNDVYFADTNSTFRDRVTGKAKGETIVEI